MKERIKKLLQLICPDAILITDLINLRYLTGFTGSSGFAIITGSKNYFLTDNRYKIQSSQEIFSAYKIIIYERESLKKIIEILKKLRVRRLGIEYETVSWGFIKKIKKELKGLRLINVSEYILSLRSVKTPEELKNIKRAIRIAEESLNEIKELIRPGIKERDIAIELEYRMLKNGADAIAFPIIVASGYRSALPHAKAGNRKLKLNDIVLIDFGCMFDGYRSDITRTFFIGKPSKLLQKAFNTVKVASKLAIEGLREGINAAEVAIEIDNYIKKAGFKDGLIHSLGHGIGLSIHELPVLNKYKEMRLMKNTVFTIEPGIYIFKKGGIRIENIVHIKKEDVQLLTTLPWDMNPLF